jgi:two-component system OmpR family sensor kinase
MFNSIRWSLQLWHAGLLSLVLAGFGTASYYGIAQARYQEVDAELERLVQLLAVGLRPMPPSRGLHPMPPSRGLHPWPPERGEMSWPAPPGVIPPPRMPWPGGGPPKWWPGPRGGPPEPVDLDVPTALAQRFGDGEEGTLYFVVWFANRGMVKSSRPTDDVPDPGPPAHDDEVAESPPRAEEPGKSSPAESGGDGRGATGPASPPGFMFLPPAPEAPRIRRRGDLREAYVYGPFGTCVLVGKSIVKDRAELRRMAWLMSATGAGVLVVGLAGGWLLSLRAIRPIRAITAAAQEISASNLSRRIDMDETQSELGTLAAVLNDAFARLEAAFEQQIRFTADASHELRTPLAVIHTHAQLALSRERSAEEYRKTIETCLRGSSRMKSLVDSLLILAKADAGRLSLERSCFDLRDVADECIAMVAPLAEEKGVSVDVDLQSVELTADASRIAQVVTNLLTNAIRYNRAGGSVRVSIVAGGEEVALAIADTGFGIPAEHQPHLFERFYRVDAARSREDGGSGLGLAICRSIVEAHGGTISFQSEAGVGTTFTIRLPRRRPAERLGE